MDIESIVDEWRSERRSYEELTQAVREAIQEAAKRLGRSCTLEARTKTIASLAKKCVRTSLDYQQIRDKSGVRILVRYPEMIAGARELVAGVFEIRDESNKGVGLAYNELGYLGLHLVVCLKGEGAAVRPDLAAKECEIQIQTTAQRLWADISHELVYKPHMDPPMAVKRAIYRLTSLLEIVDDVSSHSRAEIRKIPGFQHAQLLDTAEKYYYTMVTHSYDRELSVLVIDALLSAYSDKELEAFDSLMEIFVKANQDKLLQKYADYRDDDRVGSFVFQPETLMVFERLDAEPFVVMEEWTKKLEPALLDLLAAIWGKVL